MLAGALLIPLNLVRAEDPPRDDLELFKRFFYVANGFPPNERQLKWFVDYKDGVTHHTRGARQTGVTTFMLTIALYETKCNGINIAWFPQNSYMARFCRKRIKDMEHNLGKSVNDGKIYSEDVNYYSLMGSKRPLKVFIMNDANRLPPTYMSYTPEKVFYFGTGESQPYTT